jgi:hypothetical protein
MDDDGFLLRIPDAPDAHPDGQGDRSGVPEPAVCAALGPLGIYEAWRN